MQVKPKRCFLRTDPGLGLASILAGRTLYVTNTATDPDQPAQTLTFSLPSPPAGASINPASGIMSWRPAISQSGATYPLSVRVTDNGSPSLSATQSFAVTVLRPVQPALNSPTYRSNGFGLSISGDSGPDYSVYATTNVAKNFSTWQLLVTTSPPVLPFLFTDAGATNFHQRFYRILLGP